MAWPQPRYAPDGPLARETMTLIRDVALDLNPDEYPLPYRSEFGFRTRYLCHFLRRRAQAGRWRGLGVSKLCVRGCRADAGAPLARAGRVVVAPVRFDQEAFDGLGTQDRHEFNVAMLMAGLSKLAPCLETSTSEVASALEAFRRGGYRDEWVHQSRLLRHAGLRATLLCAMDPGRFVLTLRLERGGGTVFEGEILETKPDETIFAHRFRDVAIDRGAVIVSDRFGKTAFSLELDSLGRA